MVIFMKYVVEKDIKLFHNKVILIGKRECDMIKIAICDDEEKDRKEIVDLINQFFEDAEEKAVINVYSSGEELLSSDFVSDILFLDIIMNEKDGIQVGAEVKRNRPDTIIIYITNLSERIAEAFNYIHSFAYLVKPIEKQKVIQMLSDALEHIEYIKTKKNIKMNFFLEDNTIIDIAVENIYYFEYFNRRIKIVTKDGEYICKDKIGNIAERMKPFGFAMCHQSFVVNLYSVYQFDHLKRKLILRNGDTIDVAQKRASIIRKKLQR